MSFLDVVKHADEQRQALLEDVEIDTSTNLTITVGELNEFEGTLPVYSEDAAPGDDPDDVITKVPCAVDMTAPGAAIVGGEFHAFKQAEGGYEKGLERYQKALAEGKSEEEASEAWKMMTQIEGLIWLKGAKLGFMVDGDFMPDPSYANNDLRLVTSRALEVYVKTPFRVDEGLMEEFRQMLLNNAKWGPVELTGEQSPEPKRIEMWHLGAPTTVSASNKRGQIRERQRTGLKLSEFTITAPRPVAQRPPAPGGGVRKEYENFMFSFYENLQNVAANLAAEMPANEAAKLSSAITGIDDQGFPMRATIASLSWDEPIIGGVNKHTYEFFPDQEDDTEIEEVAS